MDAARREELEDRRRALHERADELTTRMKRLATGGGDGAEDLQRAKEMAASALRHVRDAHARAAVSHHLAAMAHLNAADWAEARGDHDRAAEHRAAARAAEEASNADALASQADDLALETARAELADRRDDG